MRILQAVLVAVVVTSCGFGNGDSSSIVVRTDSAGVTILTVSSVPTDTVVISDPGLEIGSADLDASEEETFQTITDLAVTERGTIAVVDNRGARIALFDRNGNWSGDLGRRGEGPGEHIAPLWIDQHGDTLFVWDSRLRRLSAYSESGDFRTSWSLPGKTHQGPLQVHRGVLIDEVEWGQLADPEPAAGALVRRSRSGSALDTLAGPYPVPEYGWQVTDAETGYGHMVNPPALEVGPEWAVADDHLYVLFPRKAQVAVLSPTDGHLLETVKLPRSARPLPPTDQDEFVAAMVDQFGVDRAAVESSTQFADTVAPYAGLVVDGGQRIWVSDLVPGAFVDDYRGSSWIVIDRSGERAWMVVFPPGFRLIEVVDDRAYGVHRDEYGAESVRVFAMALENQG